MEEDSPYSAIKKSLAAIPAKALNYSSRLKLANNLDSKQVLQTSKGGFARDYRGLAELIGFQYHEIKRIEEFSDRTLKILETWETKQGATLSQLISYLEVMDRFDIIDDILPSLEKNAEAYIEYQKSLESPIQVAEVTPGPVNSHFKRSAITRDDLASGESTMYDAYLSYADEDAHTAKQFADVLESRQVGLKLCIPGRDVLAGCPQLDTDMELLKNRCRHMLIILTEFFMKSPLLEFLVSFAGSLAIEQKQRILIPVIMKPCEIPPILNSVSKIDFTKEYTHEWMWDKLITSLLPEDNTAIFLSSLGRSQIRNRAIAPNLAYSLTTDNRPVITFPESAKHTLSITNDSGKVLSIAPPTDVSEDDNKDSNSCNEIEDSAVCSEIKETATSPKTSSPSSKFQLLKSVFKRKGPSTSSSTSFSSGATSGFHSQSYSNIKSMENSADNFNHDTSL